LIHSSLASKLGCRDPAIAFVVRAATVLPVTRSKVVVLSEPAAELKAKVALDLDADPQAVFAAWVDPSTMERWLFKSPTNMLETQSDPSGGRHFFNCRIRG
jgi:hypothetical protein